MLTIIVIHFVTKEHKTLQRDNYNLHVSVMGGRGKRSITAGQMGVS